MNKTGIIIQARTGSTRLPNKILMPFYNNKNILDIIIEEVKSKNPTLTIILATSTNKGDQILEQAALKHNIEFYKGDEDNVLSRFIEAAELNNLTHIIRICADNPFLQGDYILDLTKSLDKYDYVSYCFNDGTPSILSHIGLFTEGTSTEALKKVSKMTSDSLYLEHVTNFIHGNPDRFNLHYLPIDRYTNASKNIRFTLDTKSDFDILQELYQLYIEKFNKNINLLISYIENNRTVLNKMKLEIDKNTK